MRNEKISRSHSGSGVCGIVHVMHFPLLLSYEKLNRIGMSLVSRI